MKRMLLTAGVAVSLALGSTAQATAVPAPGVPVPPGVAAALIIGNELAKPKPFCKLIRIFKKKKRC